MTDPRKIDWRAFALRWGMTAVVIALLLAVPQSFEAFRVNQFSGAITLGIAALGLNLLTGYTGQISVGHGAFFGVGAYTTAILVADHGWPYLGTTAAAAVIAFGVGVLIGLPALRVKGLYLALVTLALAVVFPQIIKRFTDVTGGTQGKQVGRFRAPDWTGLAQDQFIFYLFLVFALVAWLLVYNLTRSRVGRAMVSVRDNEIGAEVLGVNVAFYKVVTFGLSAMLAGVAGSLSVYESGFVNSGEYSIVLSILILVAVVIGGVATIAGPAIGALLVTFLPEWTKGYDEQLSPVIFGAVLILLMMVAPGGVMGLLRRMRAWVARQLGSRGDRSPPDGARPDVEAAGAASALVSDAGPAGEPTDVGDH
jgi:branched-chain amino acid transport system permease protein